MKTINHIIFLILIFCSLQACREDLIDLKQSGQVKGKVVKRGTNEPIANAKITTGPTTLTVFSAADGTFEISEMPIGDYSIKAELTGYLTNFQALNIKNDAQTVTVVFEMEDDESLNTPPTIPELITPIDNAIDQPLTVQLVWNSTDADTTDVLKYKLIVKNNFNDEVWEFADLSEKNYTLENLKFGISYFWQVSVSDGIHDEVFSKINKFTTTATPNNRYHFVRKESGNYYIVSSNENGDFFNLTEPVSNSWRPRINNNAGLIAFLRTEGGNTHLFTSKPDGSQVFKVTTLPVSGFNHAELDFSWSTNGAEFIYPNFNKLYKINKDGSGQQLLYSTPDGSLISECDWSYDGSKIALKTNDVNGYNTKIFIIDLLGNTIQTIFEGVNGASGGLNFSVDGNFLVFTHDVSGYQDLNYRQLDSHIFLYNLLDNTVRDISVESEKLAGTNDLDPRFSPNNAEIIFTNTSNDGISQKNILVVDFPSGEDASRTQIFTNGEMPDYE